MRKKANGHSSKISQFDDWSFADLLAARTRIEQLLLSRRQEEAAALRQKVSALAREKGFSVKELIGKTPGGRAWKSIAPAKYRDPKNPLNTWSGRGRPPRWMQAALRSGRRTKDDFLIP